LGRAEKGTIALIDDNEDNRFIFRTWLEEQYTVVEFSEGQDVIIGMKECKPDWVFLDISLPGIDGIEVLRRIRSDR
jgi:CheY-like chemotaxis protein